MWGQCVNWLGGLREGVINGHVAVKPSNCDNATPSHCNLTLNNVHLKGIREASNTTNFYKTKHSELEQCSSLVTKFHKMDYGI